MFRYISDEFCFLRAKIYEYRHVYTPLLAQRQGGRGRVWGVGWRSFVSLGLLVKRNPKLCLIQLLVQSKTILPAAEAHGVNFTALTYQEPIHSSRSLPNNTQTYQQSEAH